MQTAPSHHRTPASARPGPPLPAGRCRRARFIVVSPPGNQSGCAYRPVVAYRQMMSAAAGSRPGTGAHAGGGPSTSDPVGQALSGSGHDESGQDLSGQDPAEQHLTRAVRALSSLQPGVRPAPYDSVRPGSGLSIARCLELFDAQMASRHLDLAARWLRARGAGYYTIGSSGPEGNAGVAAALRPTDPALLHYRSGAFYLVRAARASPPRDGA